MVLNGIDVLFTDGAALKSFSGKVALLCHGASVDKNLTHSAQRFQNYFQERFVKIFGPQHGFVTDVQDNMIETDHYTHPYFKLPVYSLYSETRIPTDEMLEGIDHLFIDLQDVGTRIYTYIYTMTHILEKCAAKEIEVVILDRPNPIGLTHIEGNILEESFASFVGRHALPVRHAMTMAEIALMHQKYWAKRSCNLKIIAARGLKREMSYEETRLPWVMPSPNAPTIDCCYTFVGTVLFEGTNISEGRGTTRPLEIVGHPGISPFEFLEHLTPKLEKLDLGDYKLRPLNFLPTFQKHAGNSCGGYQIHVLERDSFKPWRLCQILCKEFKQSLQANFQYKKDPYEYETDMNPVDMINGTDQLRHWYDEKDNYQFLNEIEAEAMPDFLEKRNQVLLYE